MDMKPTLCRLLGITDLGGSAYDVDLLAAADLPGDRLLADVTDEWCYSLFDTSTGWLMMKTPHGDDANLDSVVGLPVSEDGLVAFQLREDPGCTMVRTDEFLAHPGRGRFAVEIGALGPAAAGAAARGRLSLKFGLPVYSATRPLPRRPLLRAALRSESQP